MDRQQSDYVEPPKPVPAPPPPKEQPALVETLALGEEADHKVLASMSEDVRKSVLPQVFGDAAIPAIQRALAIGKPEVSVGDGGSLIIDTAVKSGQKAADVLLVHCSRARLENAIEKGDKMPLLLTEGHSALKLHADALDYLRSQLAPMDFEGRPKHLPAAGCFSCTLYVTTPRSRSLCKGIVPTTFSRRSNRAVLVKGKGKNNDASKQNQANAHPL
jgi:hypothetical protein